MAFIGCQTEVLTANWWQGFGAGAGVLGWSRSRSRQFGPAPAPPYIFVK